MNIYISGFHSIESQLKAKTQTINEVFIQENRSDKRLNNIIQTLQTAKINISKLPKVKLSKIATNENHQGIVASIILPNVLSENEFKFFITKQQIKLILILDNITDPRNLGACLRSANAFAVDCVVIAKDGCAAINATTYKTSSGSINDLKIFQITNIARTIKFLQKNNIWVLGLDGQATNKITNQDFSAAHAIVMGSEGKGLRQLTKKSCDNLVKIPMLGTVESLNVAVATGIILFQVRNGII